MSDTIVRAGLVLILTVTAWSQANPDCPQDTGANDGRCNFEAGFFGGIAIDTFAAPETLRYLNPGAANGLQERGVGGFSFAYRVREKLWVYGETVHGVNSADVNNNLTVAAQTANLLYILRNATTLEGFTGFRYEFLPLQPPASLYLKAQSGFLKVSGAPGNALGAGVVASGAIVTNGIFTGSYLEAGWGWSDVFQVNPRRRLKVTGYLQKDLGRGVSMFVEMLVDTDLGPGSDSLQTYVGLNFDLRRFNFFQ